MPNHLDEARSRVLEWLRARQRDPALTSPAPPMELPCRNDEIAEAFLRWARPAGFDFETVRIEREGTGAYEVRWTHRGSSFVGFKQPPPESTAEDALLAGCAALLDNQWCRKHLPE